MMTDIITNRTQDRSMAKCKTAVTPVLTHRSYCSLALSHLDDPPTFSGTAFLSKVLSLLTNCWSDNTCLAVAQSGFSCSRMHTADMTIFTNWGGDRYTLEESRYRVVQEYYTYTKCFWISNLNLNRFLAQIFRSEVCYFVLSFQQQNVWQCKYHNSGMSSNDSNKELHTDGTAQDCGISSANALEIPQYCAKPST